MVLISGMGETTTGTGTVTGTTTIQQMPTDAVVSISNTGGGTINNLRASQASLADGSSISSCPLTHHYHYIQYPAHYFQPVSHPMQPVPAQCHCPCSCGGQSNNGGDGSVPLNRRMKINNQQQSPDSQVAVAVIVHQQATGDTQSKSNHSNQQPLKTSQSAQSLLNHSYQALQHLDSTTTTTTTRTTTTTSGRRTEAKRLNIFDSSSCDCDLECTCGAAAAAAQERALIKHKQQCNLIADAMLAADEITVSESDNNSTMIKTKKKHLPTLTTGTAGKATTSTRNACFARKHNNGGGVGDVDDNDDNLDGNVDMEAGTLPEKNCNEIYHDHELDDTTEYCVKSNSTITSADDHRPPLPPRPPPTSRPHNSLTNSMGHRHGTGIKKYVVWCLICGGFSCLLGVLFLGVYFLLHSYTITVGNFETIPTFVPATLLILTGVCVMSLARRRNRYSYLIKLSGGCGLTTALTCALVTVTTTVLHMSRLQALRECEYAQKTRTCTCYSDMIESQVDRVDKEGVRLVFDSLSDCGVVHGSLYSCLRAIFGLSVAGVLISVFSCMLVYQLLSHERKKMYWEQLELRCRSLYAGQAPPPNMAAMAAAAASGRMVNCRCCEQCHAHRQLQMPLQTTTFPWDDAAGSGGGPAVEQRFWAAHPPGNFYSPNPGGEEHANAAAQACRGQSNGNERARSSGWSWPRMPWQRNTPLGGRRFRQAATSPDSQYGFSSTSDGNMLIEETLPVTVAPHNGAAFVSNALPYGVWGPPPPYSDPNSPARRGYYQYLQPNACIGVNQMVQEGTSQVTNGSNIIMEQRFGCQHQSTVTLERPDSAMNTNSTACLAPVPPVSRQAKRQHNNANNSVKSKPSEYENTTNTPSDSDGCTARERCSNTLPTRKLKKRIEVGAKSIGPNNQMVQQRPNVQQVFAEANGVHHAQDANGTLVEGQTNSLHNSTNVQCRTTVAGGNGGGTINAGGVENTGYQCSADSNGAIAVGISHVEGADVSESEVYFADVSSCCNMSVKNDNYYEDANQHRHHHHPHGHHQHQHSNCSHSSNQSNTNNNEDYLAQRFGRRENSVRSRLPFPQARLNDDYESSNLNVPTTKNVAMEQQQLQKDISRHSMCSVESEAKTEFTDLSPSTPCGNQMPPPPANFASDKTSSDMVEAVVTPQPQQMNFIASSFPYSSESQCLEAHRRSTKNIHELILNNESHYEVINDRSTYQQQQQQQQQHHQHNNGPIGSPCVGSAQRPTSLMPKSMTRMKSRSRDQLDVHTNQYHQTEREWSDGGTNGRSKRL